MKRLLALIAAIPLAALAQQNDSSFNLRDCYKNAWDDDRSSLVRTRLGVGIEPTPIELRASKEKASNKERESLSFVANRLQQCHALNVPQMRESVAPEGVEILESFDRGLIGVLTKLYSRDLAWGAGIDAIEANASEFRRRASEYNSKIEAAKQAASALQAQQERQRIAAALDAEQARQRAAQAADAQRQQAENMRREQQANQDFLNGLMLLNAARPRPMAPMLSPSVSCTSQNLNGTIHTNCR